MRAVLAGWLLAAAACGVSDEGRLPPDIKDPATLKNPRGAMALYRRALADFVLGFDAALTTGGIMTDELAALPLAPGAIGSFTLLDSRRDMSFNPNPLHHLRAQAREARGFLRNYTADSSTALLGHMYAAEGYAEIFLADLFCSGIPLSTVDFAGDYTLAAGSTTEEVYNHALALFDTALALSPDSIRIQYLAALGRSRALSGMGQYAAAAAAVAGVPDDYRYDLSAKLTFIGGAFDASTIVPPDTFKLVWYWTRPTASSGNVRREGAPSLGNLEGGNGLDYRTSGDPRTKFVAKGLNSVGQTFYMPQKYTTNGTTVGSPMSFMLASGIEARLIEAEAALQAGDTATWRTKLNHLRQNAWRSITPAVSGPLDTLADPGPDMDGDNDLRINLLFRERAFWLYLTGQRQGDLRRLIRRYNRSHAAVYPTGAYSGSSGQYGEEVVLPMPDEESRLNPKYTGCFHRNA